MVLAEVPYADDADRESGHEIEGLTNLRIDGLIGQLAGSAQSFDQFVNP
jgi:hypothetical protein